MSALLASARSALAAAETSSRAVRRFDLAYLAALRAAVVVIGSQARPDSMGQRRQAWQLLSELAPELGEWAAYFAEASAKRKAVESGGYLICSREADDLLRDAQFFLGLVGRALNTNLHARRGAG